MDFSNIAFWSGANYMKRLTDADDSQTGTVGAFSSQTITVPHTVGHIPGEYIVQAELANNGIIYSNNIPYIGMDNPANSSPTLYTRTWTSDNDLTIKVYNDTASSKTALVHWVVYMDYNV